jgi:hypothetical protein
VNASNDAALGMAWFNRLSRTERARWLDVAWKKASPLGQYSLDTMPSAADAWEAFKTAKEVPRPPRT